MTLQAIRDLALWGAKPMISGMTSGIVTYVIFAEESVYLPRGISIEVIETFGLSTSIHVLAKFTYEQALNVFKSYPSFVIFPLNFASLGVTAVVLAGVAYFLLKDKERVGFACFLPIAVAFCDVYARLVLSALGWAAARWTRS